MEMSLHLTRACWPVFSTLIDLARQARAGQDPKAEAARSRVVMAFRDAEDIVRTNADVERAWNDRVRAMLIYFADRRMVHLDWEGRYYWLEHRLETSRDGLGQPQALGGEKFFDDCDELQRQFDNANRSKRADAPLMAEQLALYYACIRMGFSGRIDGDDLVDYARRLYLTLPTQRDIREDRLFPECYAHTVDKPAKYDLRTPLILIVTVFVVLLVGTIAAYQFAWHTATRAIKEAADRFNLTTDTRPVAPRRSVPAPTPRDWLA